MRSPADHPHLRASAAAIAVAALTLAAVWSYCLSLEHRCVEALIPENLLLKDLGVAVQRAAADRPDVLPLYGTSELIKAVPARATSFFSEYPTGFAVEPLGRAGATTFTIAQRIAAMGAQLRGRPVAISLSPSFFHVGADRPLAYAGNFSALTAGECLYNSRLTLPLRRRFAMKMAEYPPTLARHPLLAASVQRLKSDTLCRDALEEFWQPLGHLQNLIYRFQDHAAVQQYIAGHRAELIVPPHRARTIKWEEEAASFARLSPPFPDPHPTEEHRRAFHEFSASGGYRHALLHSPEWADLDLLLDTLREVQAEPLILCIPLNGAYMDRLGVPREDRAFFYDHLEKVCRQHRAALRDFREWDEDSTFFLDTHDHISPKAWILIDQTLDDFFHHRPLRPGGPLATPTPAPSNSPGIVQPVRKPHPAPRPVVHPSPLS